MQDRDLLGHQGPAVGAKGEEGEWLGRLKQELIMLSSLPRVVRATETLAVAASAE